MRLTLVISQLGRGGGERVASNLANAWVEDGKSVTLLSFDHGEAPAYALHPDVKLISLGLLGSSSHFSQALSRNVSRVWRLRKAIRHSNPDLVVSFLDRTNVIAIMSTRALPVPIIVVEQVFPLLYDIGRTWTLLRRLTYRFADRLVCPTAGLVATFRALTGSNGLAIPNLIDVPTRVAHEKVRPFGAPGRVLIAMGRLVPQKGFDLLLTAFSRIADEHPEWTLKVLGGGPMLSDLLSQAESLGLGRRVQFLGPVTDPFAELQVADIFVFPSRFEGFGMALAEAMACGLPVISFNCPEGPAEIIRDGIDGILVPPEDTAALARALDRLMRDSGERQRLAARAPEVLSRFGRNHVMSLWQNLFNDLLGGVSAGTRGERNRHGSPASRII